jgi:hypothetical protein
MVRILVCPFHLGWLALEKEGTSLLPDLIDGHPKQVFFQAGALCCWDLIE